ncbi:MAG: hypothetical protein JEZ00_09760 [Anaerolineaceae bacterium]|nr:hypothetical protein [Anaerolineaceae bacterium]
MSHFPWPILFFFIFFLFITACTMNLSASPSAVAESAAVDELEPTQAATMMLTRTAAATEVPGDMLIVRIKNIATGTFLFEEGGLAVLADVQKSQISSHWQIEDYQGSKRIRNIESGNYLSIENLQDFVEVIPIESEWMSARWMFEKDNNSGSVIIRNVWHNWQILYESEGQLKYDRFSMKNKVAQWMIEPINAKAMNEQVTPEPVVVPTSAQIAGSRGASVPWIEYEAEEAVTNAEILAPDRTFGTFSAESSGRSAVKITEVGQYVQLSSLADANAIVVRYIIPDSEDGMGQDATISLYVNGEFKQKLNLTSRYAWSYGGEEYTFNTPAAGGAHHFYDEARALLDKIPAGALVSLQKDADDLAEYYVIDLIDLEQVAPPKIKPDGFLSITAFGAVADNGEDDGDAIRMAIAEAKAKNTGVWIPAGTFESTTAPFEISEAMIQGAGMWYSVIHGQYARFNCVGNNCRFYDFAILGETILRDDKAPENGFNGGAGTGSILENIWVEHTKVGWWVGPGYTNGLIIRNSRFRNLFADGVNFCNGTSNSLIENSHFRNTGDDAIASWSPNSTGVNTNNVFRFNTIQVPWRANCIAIYGGVDNKIQDNICLDVVTYPGILIAQQFNSNPFGGQTLIQRNSLIRSGGPMFRDEHGALKIWADQGDINGVVIEDLLIEGSTFTGIDLEGSYTINQTSITNVVIENSGTHAIYLRSNLNGEVSFTEVTVINPGQEALKNNSPKLKFSIINGSGNEGW